MSKELKQAIKVIGNTRLHTYDGIGNIQSKSISESHEFKVIVKALNELDELKRDVASYFGLEARFEAYKSGVEKPYGMTWNILYLNEMKRLKLKLSKVGKE